MKPLSIEWWRVIREARSNAVAALCASVLRRTTRQRQEIIRRYEASAERSSRVRQKIVDRRSRDREQDD